MSLPVAIAIRALPSQSFLISTSQSHAFCGAILSSNKHYSYNPIASPCSHKFPKRMPSVPDSSSGKPTSTGATPAKRVPTKKNRKKSKGTKPDELTFFQPLSSSPEAADLPGSLSAVKASLKELNTKYPPSRSTSQGSTPAPSRPESGNGSECPTPTQSQPQTPNEPFDISNSTGELEKRRNRSFKSSRKKHYNIEWNEFDESRIKQEDNEELYNLILRNYFSLIALTNGSD